MLLTNILTFLDFNHQKANFLLIFFGVFIIPEE